jgi:hypothetical protein
MSKEIEIIIEKDGTVHMEALDFKGKECHAALEKIRKKLGKIIKVSKKSEFYKGGEKEQTRTRE